MMRYLQHIGLVLAAFLVFLVLSEEGYAQKSCKSGWKKCDDQYGGCCRNSWTCHPSLNKCCRPGTTPTSTGCHDPNAKKPVIPPKKKVTQPKKKPPAGPTCSVCDRHFLGNLNRALGVTGNVVVNVQQAVNDYHRCRQRAAIASGKGCPHNATYNRVRYGVGGCLTNFRNHEGNFLACVSKVK